MLTRQQLLDVSAALWTAELSGCSDDKELVARWRKLRRQIDKATGSKFRRLPKVHPMTLTEARKATPNAPN